MIHALLTLVGHVCLLLWSLQMLQRSVDRSWGAQIRRLMNRGDERALRSFAVGAAATTILQSSTTAILALASWTSQGLIPLGVGIAAALGANVGTTFIAQSFSFLSIEIAPLFALVGFVMFRKGRLASTRDFGRVLIALGIGLFSVHGLSAALSPMSQSTTFQLVMHAMSSEPLAALLASAAFAWLSHSSIAAILLIVSLAQVDELSSQAALAMVLGANLGTALNPLLYSRSAQVDALRLASANILTRLIGCAMVWPALMFADVWIESLGASTQRIVFNFHTIFNVAVALLFLPVVPWMARQLTRLFPERVRADDPALPRYLHAREADSATVALTKAEREALRMADIVVEMLDRSRGIFACNDRDRITDVRALDDTLDSLHESIQRYLAGVGGQPLSQRERLRAQTILTFAVNLEHIGDVLGQLLMKRASKRIKRQVSLSEDELSVIEQLYDSLREHLQLSIVVFMYTDVKAARQLLKDSENFRQIERQVALRHFDAICSGRGEGVSAAGLYLDAVRDLCWANSRLVATADLAVKYRAAAP